MPCGTCFPVPWILHNLLFIDATPRHGKHTKTSKVVHRLSTSRGQLNGVDLESCNIADKSYVGQSQVVSSISVSAFLVSVIGIATLRNENDEAFQRK